MLGKKTTNRGRNPLVWLAPHSPVPVSAFGEWKSVAAPFPMFEVPRKKNPPSVKRKTQNQNRHRITHLTKRQKKCRTYFRLIFHKIVSLSETQECQKTKPQLHGTRQNTMELLKRIFRGKVREGENQRRVVRRIFCFSVLGWAFCKIKSIWRE